MPSKPSFSTAFASALQGVTAHTAATWESQAVAASAENDPAGLSAALAVALRLGGGLEGELFLCPDATASRHTFSSAADMAPAELSAAWQNLCQDSAGQMAGTLAAHFGELRIEDCRVLSLPALATPLADVVLRSAADAPGTIFLLSDAALHSSLERRRIAAHPPMASIPPDPPEGSCPEAPLQRVIDVPLAVTLRFGQRKLTLRELLDLRSGSLVELDQQVEEPVSLMLGERLIARGEVVIVDGNYGMRVTEVVENNAYQLSAGA